MKHLILIFTLLIATNSYADQSNKIDCSNGIASEIFNTCKEDKFEPDTTVEDHETFDWGAHLDLVLFETFNTEWTAKGTYYYESNETRVTVGGKIYLNRFLWQK